jgi:hypothetical protein
MNITNPKECEYLKSMANRQMSYSRQKSLARAVSYRQTLLTRNGELADNQYVDQYIDKSDLRNALRKQHNQRSLSPSAADGCVVAALTKYVLKLVDVMSSANSWRHC